MTKKKAAQSDDDIKDLTRIEDLSEFLHQEDSDLDSVFEAYSSSNKRAVNDDPTSPGLDISALDDGDELPPDLPAESIEEEITFEATSFDEVSTEESNSTLFEESSEFESSFESDLEEGSGFEENLETDLNESSEGELGSALFDSENSFENEATDESINHESSNTSNFDSFETNESHTQPVYNIPPIERETETQERLASPPENFSDVKSFAQNFSYGKVSLGGGNPPYSIILRHIKFKEDADDILNLLREFGIVTDTNEKDHLRALELGSIIIPQISEYTAIILAHKFRRFDLDLQVGLSDEIHPSKSGDTNPKGLLKKDNLKQNKSESLKISEKKSSIKELIVSTAATLPGYTIENFLGVETTLAIVDEAELEKLQYVQRTLRSKSEIFDYSIDDSNLTTDQAFKDYQYSFSLLYEDLTNQLKQKAFTQNANALLGLNFQLSQIQFERSGSRINAYQITCSATMAFVQRENP